MNPGPGESPIKRGRPRRYALQPLSDFANADAAALAASIEEMTERVFDLVEDLPADALDYLPPGGNNTIAMLVLHMIAGEAFWIARVSQTALPESLLAQISEGTQDASGQLPHTARTAAELVAAAREVRTNWTLPFLASQRTIDDPVQNGERVLTIRGVLTHLVWHWTYHAGQVGLLRRLAGARYEWTFDPRIGK